MGIQLDLNVILVGVFINKKEHITVPNVIMICVMNVQNYQPKYVCHDQAKKEISFHSSKPKLHDSKIANKMFNVIFELSNKNKYHDNKNYI